MWPKKFLFHLLAQCRHIYFPLELCGQNLSEASMVTVSNHILDIKKTYMVKYGILGLFRRRSLQEKTWECLHLRNNIGFNMIMLIQHTLAFVKMITTHQVSKHLAIQDGLMCGQVDILCKTITPLYKHVSFFVKHSTFGVPFHVSTSDALFPHHSLVSLRFTFMTTTLRIQKQYKKPKFICVH